MVMYAVFFLPLTWYIWTSSAFLERLSSLDNLHYYERLCLYVNLPCGLFHLALTLYYDLKVKVGSYMYFDIQIASVFLF